MTATTAAPARQGNRRVGGPTPTSRPHVRIRQVADETVFDVHHGRRRITWPTWGIAMAHANRLATVEAKRRALAQARGVA